MNHSTSAQYKHSQKIVDELQHFLADTYVLYLKTQNFHWNIKGFGFYNFHKMLEEQYLELAEATDEIAERIRALGCYAPASFSQYSQLASIKEQVEYVDTKTMLSILLKDHETMSKTAISMIPKAQKGCDEGTADLLVGRSKVHDKIVWMLKSTLS
ncbi:DNA starvation/stationary phase protection protein [Gammaproteobacteria bacterium]|nr:DNA starvation/stationary phase protection protein [Gammaproteobacteria bacterium]